MFPPKPTENPKDWLNGLCCSLQRAAPILADTATIHFDNVEHLEIVLSFQERPTPEQRKLLTRYIFLYSRACGWLVRVRQQKNYLVLAASRAASRVAKKL